jgi:hypothetical protein
MVVFVTSQTATEIVKNLCHKPLAKLDLLLSRLWQMPSIADNRAGCGKDRVIVGQGWSQSFVASARGSDLDIVSGRLEGLESEHIAG